MDSGYEVCKNSFHCFFTFSLSLKLFQNNNLEKHVKVYTKNPPGSTRAAHLIPCHCLDFPPFFFSYLVLLIVELEWIYNEAGETIPNLLTGRPRYSFHCSTGEDENTPLGRPLTSLKSSVVVDFLMNILFL